MIIAIFFFHHHHHSYCHHHCMPPPPLVWLRTINAYYHHDHDHDHDYPCLDPHPCSSMFIHVHLEKTYFNWDFVVIIRLIVGHLHRGVPSPEPENIKKWDKNTIRFLSRNETKIKSKFEIPQKTFHRLTYIYIIFSLFTFQIVFSTFHIFITLTRSDDCCTLKSKCDIKQSRIFYHEIFWPNKFLLCRFEC